MARYLLDSDAFIDYLFSVPATIHLLDRLYDNGDALSTCSVVIAEIYTGLLPQHQERASLFVERCLYLHTSPRAAMQAGVWRKAHRQHGDPLSITDALIAVTAQENGAVIVTGDAAFRRIPELEVLPLPRR